MRQAIGYLALIITFGLPQTLGAGGFLGHLSTAEPVPHGAVDLGAHVGFYEDANALFGHFRIGAIRYCEWEIKAGVLDMEGDSDPRVMAGTAFKYHFYHRGDVDAPDMAVNWIIEYYDFARASTLILGSGLIGSYPFRLSNNSDLTPYGRLCLRAERNEWEVHTRYVPVKEEHDWDFDIGLNLGTQYAPSNRIQIYGELQFDDQVGFIAGINFAVY